MSTTRKPLHNFEDTDLVFAACENGMKYQLLSREAYYSSLLDPDRKTKKQNGTPGVLGVYRGKCVVRKPLPMRPMENLHYVYQNTATIRVNLEPGGSVFFHNLKGSLAPYNNGFAANGGSAPNKNYTFERIGETYRLKNTGATEPVHILLKYVPQEQVSLFSLVVGDKYLFTKRYDTEGEASDNGPDTGSMGKYWAMDFNCLYVHKIENGENFPSETVSPFLKIINGRIICTRPSNSLGVWDGKIYYISGKNPSHFGDGAVALGELFDNIYKASREFYTKTSRMPFRNGKYRHYNLGVDGYHMFKIFFGQTEKGKGLLIYKPSFITSEELANGEIFLDFKHLQRRGVDNEVTSIVISTSTMFQFGDFEFLSETALSDIGLPSIDYVRLSRARVNSYLRERGFDTFERYVNKRCFPNIFRVLKKKFHVNHSFLSRCGMKYEVMMRDRYRGVLCQPSKIVVWNKSNYLEF